MTSKMYISINKLNKLQFTMGKMFQIDDIHCNFYNTCFIKFKKESSNLNNVDRHTYYTSIKNSFYQLQKR